MATLGLAKPPDSPGDSSQDAEHNMAKTSDKIFCCDAPALTITSPKTPAGRSRQCRLLSYHIEELAKLPGPVTLQEDTEIIQMVLGHRGEMMIKIHNMTAFKQHSRYFFHYTKNGTTVFEELSKNDYLISTKYQDTKVFVTVTCEPLDLEADHGPFLCRMMEKKDPGEGIVAEDDWELESRTLGSPPLNPRHREEFHGDHAYLYRHLLEQGLLEGMNFQMG